MMPYKIAVLCYISNTRGELLLLECDPLALAVEELRHHPEIIDAAVFGNALHLVVPNAAQAIPEVKRFLQTKNITVSYVEEIHPSLEDVLPIGKAHAAAAK